MVIAVTVVPSVGDVTAALSAKLTVIGLQSYYR